MKKKSKKKGLVALIIIVIILCVITTIRVLSPSPHTAQSNSGVENPSPVVKPIPTPPVEPSPSHEEIVQRAKVVSKAAQRQAIVGQGYGLLYDVQPSEADPNNAEDPTTNAGTDAENDAQATDNVDLDFVDPENEETSPTAADTPPEPVVEPEPAPAPKPVVKKAAPKSTKPAAKKAKPSAKSKSSSNEGARNAAATSLMNAILSAERTGDTGRACKLYGQAMRNTDIPKDKRATYTRKYRSCSAAQR